METESVRIMNIWKLILLPKKEHTVPLFGFINSNRYSLYKNRENSLCHTF